MPKPLTERIVATLRKHGPASTDTIAQRISVKARLVSPRLSALKHKGLVRDKAGEGGETVWSAAKPA